MIAWSHAEPARVGHVAYVPRGDRGAILGRGEARPEDAAPRLFFGAERPGRPRVLPLSAPGLSRQQLRVRARGDHLRVQCIGKLPMRVHGREVSEAEVAPGEVIELSRELLILCEEREPLVPGDREPPFAFGMPDPHGWVGEGSAAWLLRDEIALAAGGPNHVLVTGPSGAGKELLARAIHALSPRASGPFVARNAATLPHGIIDAELFGNAKNYPNSGMRERAGLFGEADSGTLFLDEIGELPEELQAHLLRVLDQGEYHRLGEDRARRVDVRVVAATNRDVASLKHDFAARLKVRVSVPGLSERRADIPLLARVLLRELAKNAPAVRERFFDADEPRIAPELVSALLAHEWTAHVRELEGLLIVALRESRQHFVALTKGVQERLRLPARPTREPPSREEIEEALALASGNVSRAYQSLGLPSRDALNRLIKKLGIRVQRE